jgi:hypothetical protein
MIRIAAALAIVSASAASLHADDSALIDILQRKGVLSTKEASELRKEIAKEQHEDSASKIKLSSSVSELKLYGDLRLRYQYDAKDTQLSPAQGGGSNVSQRSRWRFRLRLNADVKLGEHWFAGVELQTENASDSSNQTYENGFGDYDIFISKAYLGWKPVEWFTLTGGKFNNPFYTTDLVWDPDINPNGISEVIAFHKLGGGEAGGGYSKDGKSLKDVHPPESPWELTLVAGQFIFDDNLEYAGPDNDSSTDAYLFQTQLIASYQFDHAKVTIAPAWFTYVNGSLSGLANNSAFQDNAFVSGATRNLNLILAPGDVSFHIGQTKAKIYWDLAYNIEGSERVQDIYRLANSVGNPQHESVDDFAYLVGFQVGENKKAGDWSFLGNWRQIGLGAVDPNLNDSDFSQSELNTRGFKASLSYNFTPFAIGTITYGYAWNLRDALFGGEATGGNAVADSNEVQLLQVDLNVKF